jgi:hypothetical protein
MNPKGLQSRKENGHLMRLRHWHLFIVWLNGDTI